MEFLVEMDIDAPAEVDPEQWEALRGAEADRARELQRAGSIVRIWRVPGRTANIGIWEADDATELHDVVTSLPLYPYMSVSVKPLATHYLEA